MDPSSPPAQPNHSPAAEDADSTTTQRPHSPTTDPQGGDAYLAEDMDRAESANHELATDPASVCDATTSADTDVPAQPAAVVQDGPPAENVPIRKNRRGQPTLLEAAIAAIERKYAQPPPAHLHHTRSQRSDPEQRS
ncbi:hypothetical protein QAD02_012964 [Eretmocerus hayati]|uniref:Uncharacterized protein n=1 Tax=Eretmocerus hayati TaxID=131215 RepID=A0ACC2P1C5_9HYME|nr:hypothetical protein QAD02_012964 [Eretmocerus hayati]